MARMKNGKKSHGIIFFSKATFSLISLGVFNLRQKIENSANAFPTHQTLCDGMRKTRKLKCVCSLNFKCIRPSKHPAVKQIFIIATLFDDELSETIFFVSLRAIKNHQRA